MQIFVEQDRRKRILGQKYWIRPQKPPDDKLLTVFYFFNLCGVCQVLAKPAEKKPGQAKIRLTTKEVTPTHNPPPTVQYLAP